MHFEPSDKVKQIQSQIQRFVDEHVYPAERVAEEQIEKSGDPHHFPQIVKDLQAKAKSLGLWNLFLPDKEYGAGLTNLEYAPLAEIMGRSAIASRAFNCAAPDTGNMEILAEFGTPEQKKEWLEPLLGGEIRSCFSMTEPEVSGADPTGLRTRAVRGFVQPQVGEDESRAGLGSAVTGESRVDGGIKHTGVNIHSCFFVGNHESFFSGSGRLPGFVKGMLCAHKRQLSGA